MQMPCNRQPANLSPKNSARVLKNLSPVTETLPFPAGPGKAIAFKVEVLL